jgi:VWFA-related protein
MLSRLKLTLTVLALVLGLWFPAAIDAQEKPDGERGTLPTFKANVNVVNLYFNVKDKHGLLIPNLGKDDFEVLEDGTPQTIKYFSSDASQPLTLGILIDSSASQTRVLGIEKEVGASFLRNVLREKDLAYIISFDVNVDLLQDFTNSVSDLRAALNRAKINAGSPGGMPGMGGGPFPTSGVPRGTLLYDAIWLGAREKLSAEVGRKAMIILTDGEDQGSQETIKNAIEASQKADAMVYVILIADRGFYSGQGMGYSGDRAMRDLARDTGGRVINVGNNEKKLKDAFDQISAELRSQYSIGYTPSNAKLDGGFRKVEIHTRNKDQKIQARSGYYALKSTTGN